MRRCYVLSVLIMLGAVSPLQAEPSYFTNKIGMKFVWIPPGVFTMGSPLEEKGRNPLEVPHRVTLTSGFFMGVYPVTQDQWHKVVSSTGYIAPAEGFDLLNPSRFVNLGNNPVDSVSWDHCQNFLKALRAIDKRHYRLPTEAEWEYACRAGDIRPQVNAPLKKAKSTMPVGRFPPNAFGVCDMNGNVAQWCEDRLAPYPTGSVTDPQGPDKGGNRVLRGASWEDGPAAYRPAARGWDAPVNRGQGTYGFRVCITPK